MIAPLPKRSGTAKNLLPLRSLRPTGSSPTVQSHSYPSSLPSLPSLPSVRAELILIRVDSRPFAVRNVVSSAFTLIMSLPLDLVRTFLASYFRPISERKLRASDHAGAEICGRIAIRLRFQRGVLQVISVNLVKISGSLTSVSGQPSWRVNLPHANGVGRPSHVTGPLRLVTLHVTVQPFPTP